jgi:hypothetical protein
MDNQFGREESESVNHEPNGAKWKDFLGPEIPMFGKWKRIVHYSEASDFLTEEPFFSEEALPEDR